MKVFVTGASGNLGSDVISRLQSEIEFVSLGRQNGDIPWQLGLKPDPERFMTADAILHFAWSLHDREKDFHLNVGGTALLAEFASDLGIPFIFISSIAVGGTSHYGRAKLEAERYVTELGGICVRVGLVPDLNNYIRDEARFRIKLVPALSGRIIITEAEKLSTAVKSLLAGFKAGEAIASGTVTLITRFTPVQEVFGEGRGPRLRFPNTLILIVLKLISKISRRGRNLQDSYRSLVTTLESE